MQGSTVLIIAHRFATLQKVDRIVVLCNGAIETVGTHAECRINGNQRLLPRVMHEAIFKTLMSA